ncbi:uncharacterized protein E5676_scaffold333G00350 [Cucumis melo var. makuwa]|uniref:Uncharacterized protein n=1 Tax=Cucumis melo var. makuwa TaxID=1194695 RepID=A0A5D3DF12_CUCMM|nr:uncharacterized protein E6C27_scaffold219G00420 [Cucumis melo var. makuwa]TYK22174.1 uncharacterized protein E5676_scaffold333G00350 [Cucumis melo var. makuwa]
MTECEIVALMQVIIDVFKNGVPENMKDPESFTVPCSIGNVDLGRSLFDLGASCTLIDVHQGKLTMWLNHQEDYCKEEVFAKLLSSEEIYEEEFPEGILEEMNVVCDARKLECH